MNLISSPFYFDSDSVRVSCLEALGVSDTLGINEIVEVTSSTLTLNKEDHVGKIVIVATAEPSSTVVTLPLEATGGFEDKDQITIIRGGSGEVSISAAEGVSISTAETTDLRKLGSAVQLIRVDTNSWFLIGDTIPAEFNGISGISVPAVNDPWNYVPATTTTIGNISYRGVEPTLATDTITIPKLYGMPFECQLDGIQLLSLSDTNTSFTIENFTAEAGVDITVDIGVSPFPIGGEKWLLNGFRLTYTSVGGTWSFDVIQYGESIADYSITTIGDTIAAGYLTSTEQVTYSWDAGGSTYSTSVEAFNGPLYSRIFINGPITDPISFDLVITAAVTNGKGNNLPVRLILGDNSIVEVPANVI